MPSLRDEIDGVIERVQVFLDLGRYDTAANLLSATISDYGHMANLHNLLGVTYHRESRFDDAIQEFHRALESNPSFIDASLNLAATFCDLSQYAKAEEIYNILETQEEAGRNSSTTKTTKTKGVPPLFLGRIANQHAKCGKMYSECLLHSDAIREFKVALSLFPMMTDVKLALAQTYTKVGRLTEAKNELEDLVRMNPNSSNALISLGNVYFKLGSLDLAQRQWGTAHQHFPRDLAGRAYQSLVTSWSINKDPADAQPSTREQLSDH